MAETENKNEGTVQLSGAELKDIRSLLAKSAEKDQIIENLTQKTAVLEAELAKTQSASTAQTKKPGDRKITTWYARLRKYQGKWVLGWKEPGVYREQNARGGVDEFMNIIVKGVDKPVKIPFLTYINECPQETVKIKEKRKLDPVVTNQGEVEKMVFDEKQGVMIGLGYSVPVEVVSEPYEYVFDLDGEDVVINETYVNR